MADSLIEMNVLGNRGHVDREQGDIEKLIEINVMGGKLIESREIERS